MSSNQISTLTSGTINGLNSLNLDELNTTTLNAGTMDGELFYIDRIEANEIIVDTNLQLTNTGVISVGNVEISDVELTYLNGVSSNIQTQIDNVNSVNSGLVNTVNTHTSQITNLQNDVSNLQSDVVVLQTNDLAQDGDILNLQTTTQNHTTQIGNLQTTTGTNTTNITNLQTTTQNHTTDITNLQTTTGTNTTNITNLQTTTQNHTTDITTLESKTQNIFLSGTYYSANHTNMNKPIQFAILPDTSPLEAIKITHSNNKFISAWGILNNRQWIIGQKDTGLAHLYIENETSTDITIKGNGIINLVVQPTQNIVIKSNAVYVGNTDVASTGNGRHSNMLFRNANNTAWETQSSAFTEADKAAISNNALPVGSVIAFGGVFPPTGYLLCDGNFYSQTAYPALFAVISTYFSSGRLVQPPAGQFAVPDLRQNYISGVGTISNHAHDIVYGVDRNVGSFSKSSIQNHTHSIIVHDGTVGIAQGNLTNNNVGNDADTIKTTQIGVKNDNGTTMHENKTQPSNVAMNFIIKY